MRSLIVSLTALGFAHHAVAGPLDSIPLRGSRGYEAAKPVYRVVTAPPPVAGEASPIYAADPAYPPVAHPRPYLHLPPQQPRSSSFEIEIGARYWYTSGRLAKDLYDDPRISSSLNSRLTYSGLDAHVGEVFARGDDASGVFLKGYAGLGSIISGRLVDEDFPPSLPLYSSTLSEQRNGHLSYLTADIGYAFAEGRRFRLGAFLGYSYFAERVNAFGCTQTTVNFFICVPPIAANVRAVTEDAKWHGARLGLAGDVRIADRLKLSGEAVWLPYVLLKAYDTHWLRVGSSLWDLSGPIPQRGTGWGMQFEAMLSYQFTDRLWLGVGARYWQMESKGSADLEYVINGYPDPVAQPINFITRRYGVFAQAAYKFGPM